MRFRRLAHADAMRDVFTDQLRAARTSGRWTAVTALWLRTIMRMSAAALREHRASARVSRGTAVLDFFRYDLRLTGRALKDLGDTGTPPPTATDDSGRSAQRFELMVQLVQGGRTRTAGVRGQDIYAVTAPIVVEVAQRLLPRARQRRHRGRHGIWRVVGGGHAAILADPSPRSQ